MQTFYGNIKFAEGGQNVDKPMVLSKLCVMMQENENKVVAPNGSWINSPIPKWSER